MLFTSLHCTLHAAEAAVAQPSECHATEVPHRKAPAPCEHESGCLCRGAIVAKSVDVPCIFAAGEWIHDLAFSSAPHFLIPASTIVATASLKPGGDSPPAISGRALRAWVGSLQC